MYAPRASSGAAAPRGTIVPFAGTTAPASWLICDGSEVSRVTYAELFGVIGETYGAGDLSTTFNLPDLRGRVPAGTDIGAGRLTGAVLGAILGSETNALNEAQLPAHSHTYDNVLGNSVYSTQSAGIAADFYAVLSPSASITPTTPSTSAVGSGNSFPIVQPTLILNYIIHI